MAVKRLSDGSSLANSFKLSRGATSVAKPQAPTIGTATKTGADTATVAYTAATLGAAASSFTATSTPGSLTGTGTSPITVTGLTSQTNYTFTVKATNANGDSANSASSNQITTDAALASYDAIATISGTGSSDVITFSSIPSTYKHLQIRGVQVVDYGSADYGNAGIRFNGDTAQNYTTHAMRGFYDTTANQQGLNYTLGGGLNYGMILGAYLGNTTNIMFPTIIDILNYANTGNRKVAKGWSGTTYLNNSFANRGFLQTASTFWDSNAAINSISLFASNGSWNTKTKFTLYGIKDS